MPLQCRQLPPVLRGRLIHRAAEARLMQRAKLILRHRQSLFRRLRQPPPCLGIILRHAMPVAEKHTQAALRFAVACSQ